MAYTTYNCDSMTGGAARSLDILSVGDLTNGDRAIVMTTAASYFFKYNSSGTAAEQVATSPRVVRPDDYSSAGNWEEHVAAASSSASVLVQVQHAVVNEVVSGSTIMPDDDTIPQITEGNEIITCAITPTSATNKLLIVAALGKVYANASDCGNMALFQDSTANALAAVSIGGTLSYQYQPAVTLTHSMVAGTTSETTFKIRAGIAGSGTIYVNGTTTRKMGGVSATTLTIFEYTV